MVTRPICLLNFCFSAVLDEQEEVLLAPESVPHFYERIQRGLPADHVDAVPVVKVHEFQSSEGVHFRLGEIKKKIRVISRDLG